MTTLKFADTHNMVAFLTKPAESEGFEQIVDFLNANPIRYALTINPTIYISCIEQFWSTVKAKTVNGEVQLQALVDGKKIIITESTVRRDLQLEDAEGVDCLPNATIFEQLTLMGKPKRKDTQIPQSSGPIDNVAYEAVNEEIDDSLERAATTATSLDLEQDRGGGPRCQETIRDNIAQTRFENVSKTSNDLLLIRGNILRSGEDSLKLNELMELCTNLEQRVLDLETTKTTQANEISSLKRRVKKLERRNKSRTHWLKRMYRVGSSRTVESSEDEVNAHTDEDMFGVNDVDGDEVIVDNVDVVKTAKETRSVVEEVTAIIEKAKLVSVAEEIVNAAATTVTLAELKSTKPKAVKVVIQEPEQGITTTSPITIIFIPKPLQDKGKGIMIEEPVVEQVKLIKRLEQMRLDEELAFKLQAEEEEERLAREKAQQTEEANIAWDDVQAKIEADYQLAQRLQAQEQEELTDEEKARLFVQFLEQRRKHFAAKRAEEKRNRPPTRAQQRSIMCTYLKNMEGWKPKNLKNKSFANIQELFDKAMKRVNTFVDYRTELVEESSKKAEAEIAQESSSKRAGDELEQENAKKQKVDEDKETVELQSLMEVIPDEEEVAIDVVPLATKPPTIVDWKIHKEGKKSYYQIIRADGKSQMYRVFSQMLKSFSREDLEDLYKLVKAKYGLTRPVEDLDLILWGDLKTMFEPHVEDQVLKNQDNYSVLD
ncbi:hypothetical protein Tco_0462203 [Tanacetum coccineum]